MKRLMIILAVTAAIFASCSKSEPESGKNDVNENGRIKINLSVSNPGSGDDSKALVKTDWADGDQLLIWFDANAGEKPDMVIKYNGSSWDYDESAEVSGKTPAASGSMKVLYNNILCVTAKDPYEFADNTLSGRIQTWTFLTEIQVIVSGLTPADYGKYSLSCSNFTPFTGYKVGTESITAQAGDAGTFVQGISNTDGVAFVFASCTKYDAEAKYYFSLNDGTSSGASASTPTTPECVEIKAKYDGTTETTLKWAKWNVGASKPEEYGYYFFWGGTQGYVYGTAKGYTKYNNLAKNVSQIKGIKIAGSSFSSKECWVNAETGEELVDGCCWENTPFNNGSWNYNETYFESVRSTVCPGDVLAKDYDAACKYLGGNFRMPTSAEFNAMNKATYWAWDGTDKGYYVFKPDASHKADTIVGSVPADLNTADALLFFPAAGHGLDTYLHFAGSDGHYWSSSLNSSEPGDAYHLNFDSSFVAPQGCYYFRYRGFTVRPVSD